MAKERENNFIKFLGTAGARFVMIKQLRSSAGIWIRSSNTNILIDPGPGSIVRCALSRPKIDPSVLDGIILTHRHLDHANDINVMIEAMTEGGFKKRGVVFCPSDAIMQDRVILKYAMAFPEKIEILKEQSRYKVKNFIFKTSIRHIHPTETYGIKFKIGNREVALLSDTRYSQKLINFYTKLDTLILPVVFFQPRPEIDHLSLPETEQIIALTKPKRAILTHFGMTMLRAKPYIQAKELSRRLAIEVIAAYDGMSVKF